MTSTLEFFGSLSSPYCYFALDRIEALARDHNIQIFIRPVLPGVIRNADRWSESPAIEREYFDHDMQRTADFLELPYGDPHPPLVNWPSDGSWAVSPEQEHVYWLYNALYSANLHRRCYELYASLMRLIWRGEINDWNRSDHIQACLVQCGLPPDLADQPTCLTPNAEAYFAENDQALLHSGHWGVPTFCWNGEPFFGQDRIDQLRWKIERR